MSKVVLSTQRLILREFRQEDATGFFLMNSDPEVIRYTGDSAFKSVKEAASFIAAYDHYQLYGYGRWTVIRRSNEQYIGFCGLKYHPKLQITDLGFRLVRSCWGKGYGTEAASACLRFGLKTLRLPKIVGRVAKANLASIRVLEKIGMQCVREFDFEGKPAYWYEAEAESIKY